jgi:hypothetical protein
MRFAAMDCDCRDWPRVLLSCFAFDSGKYRTLAKSCKKDVELAFRGQALQVEIFDVYMKGTLALGVAEHQDAG